MEQTTKSHASHHLLAPRQKLEHPLHHTPPSTSAVFGGARLVHVVNSWIVCPSEAWQIILHFCGFDC